MGHGRYWGPTDGKQRRSGKPIRKSSARKKKRKKKKK